MLIPALFVVQIALWPKGLSTGLVTHLHTNGTTPVITDDTTTGNESAQAPAIFYAPLQRSYHATDEFSSTQAGAQQSLVAALLRWRRREERAARHATLSVRARMQIGDGGRSARYAYDASAASRAARVGLDADCATQGRPAALANLRRRLTPRVDRRATTRAKGGMI
ncbi:hypothetical protein MRX96_029256 [Rhipicephalus microplus]